MKVKGARTKNMADAHPKRRIIMANKSAKKALEQFKMQAASEVGVNLNNGDLTSRQAGSIGGQMVKVMRPVRTMNFERPSRVSKGHKILFTYGFFISV